MSRESKLINSTLILSIGTILPKLASFVTLPILTACLTKAQYGTYDLITILVSLVLPITTLQIHTAGFRFLVEHQNDRNLARVYLSNILAFVTPVAIVSLTILFFFLPISSILLKSLICIYFFFDTIVTEVREVIRGLSKNLDYSISATINAAVNMVLAVIFVLLLKKELTGAVIALAISPFISLVYLFLKQRVWELIDFKQVKRDVLKELVSYSWPMVPNNLSGWVMRVSDRFVVTGFMGLAANGVYAVANKIPHILSLAQYTFAMAWQENASLASKDEDAGQYYSKMFSLMTDFYAGCLGLIIACTPILFRLLIKGDYSEAYPQMPILFIAMFFSCMSIFLGGIYIACKATKSVGITTALAAVCNLIVDLVLIKKIGLFAASGSTLISYIFLFIYRMVDVKKLVKIEYNLKRLIIAIMLITIECVLCFINKVTVNVLNVCLGTVSFFVLNKQIVSALMYRIKNHL